MAKGAEIATMPPLPVAFPSHVRSFIRRISPGMLIEILRDDVALAQFTAEGSAMNLANFREIVSRSVESTGHARFTICVEDRECPMDSNEVVDVARAGDGSQASWQGFAQRMEGIVFRLIDKLDAQATKNSDNIDRLLKAQRKLVTASAELIRHDIERIDEARDATEAEDGEMEKLKFARETLGMFGPAAGGGAASSPPAVKSTRDRCIALLNEKERAAVLNTMEGQAVLEATTDLALKVAFKGLVALVQSGQLAISKETLAAVIPIVNGDA